MVNPCSCGNEENGAILEIFFHILKKFAKQGNIQPESATKL